METLNNCRINEIYELAPQKHTHFYVKKKIWWGNAGLYSIVSL